MNAADVPSRHIPLLDGYRALAAGLISLSHLAIALGRQGCDALVTLEAVGRIGGVDFFFVLSGFLLHWVYGPRAGQAPAGRFLLRRLVRIFPLVWLFTLLSLAVYAAVPRAGFGDGHEFDVVRIVRSLLLLPDDELPILGATWSLRHVLAFYLVYAAYLSRPAPMRVAVVAWAGLVVMALAAGWRPASATLAFLLDPFNLLFLAGVAVAVVLRRHAPRHAWPAFSVGLLAFALAWATLRDADPGGWQTKMLLYGMGSCALIAGACSLQARRTLQLPRLVRRVGDASYAMIVLNLPVTLLGAKLLAVAGWLQPAFMPLIVPGLLSAVVAASWFTDRWIDQPMRRGIEARLLGRGPRAPGADAAAAPAKALHSSAG